MPKSYVSKLPKRPGQPLMKTAPETVGRPLSAVLRRGAARASTDGAAAQSGMGLPRHARAFFVLTEPARTPARPPLSYNGMAGRAEVRAGAIPREWKML